MEEAAYAAQNSPQSARLANINEAAQALNVPRSWLYKRTRKTRSRS